MDKNNLLVGVSECKLKETNEIKNIPISYEMFNNALNDIRMYKYDGTTIVDNPDYYLIELEKNINKAKVERTISVANITVEVDGMIFDGDEKSQDRMARTITAAKTLNLPEETTIEWTLADNSAAQVTVQQLAQALYLAGQAQTAIWRTPYNN